MCIGVRLGSEGLVEGCTWVFDGACILTLFVVGKVIVAFLAWTKLRNFVRSCSMGLYDTMDVAVRTISDVRGNIVQCGLTTFIDHWNSKDFICRTVLSLVEYINASGIS
jgi:hypothetical protein